MHANEKYDINSMKCMESWRGILAIFVLIAHIFQLNISPYIQNSPIIEGIMGSLSNISVIIFFILSWILISYSAASIRENGVFDWKKYIINRVTRIYPSLFFVTLLSLIFVFIFPLITGSSEITTYTNEVNLARNSYIVASRDYILTLLMLPSGMYQINWPLWSLTIEWWIYIAFMFLFIGINSKKGIYWYTAALIVLMFIIDWTSIKNIVYIFIWFIGALYTLYLRHHPNIMKMVRYSSYGLMMLYLIYFWISGMDITKNSWEVYGIFQFLVAILSIELVLRINLGKIIGFTASFSYTLYILHFPLLLFLFWIFHKYSFISWYPIVSSILYFFFALISAYYISKITENKAFYRRLFSSR